MKLSALVKVMNFYMRFSPSYTKTGYYARSLLWSHKSYDFSGQQWLVTGANSGLGKSVMHTAATAGARVLAVARNRARLEAAVAELAEDVAARVTPLVFDLSLQRDTENLLQSLLAQETKFDVLVNNVGVLLNDLSINAEHRETSFATNLLSHFQLTEGLLEKSAFNAGATIVNMSSGGMYNVPLSIQGLHTVDPAAYNGKIAYAFAKRGQVALTTHWNRKYGNNGLRVYVTHPGWTRTPGVDAALPGLVKTQGLLLRNPAQGADTCIWLCANRPDIGAEEVIWFDRKPRPTHMYDRTRKPLCTIDELVEYLRSELDAGPPGATAAA